MFPALIPSLQSIDKFAVIFRTEKKVKVGKKISYRPKERIAFVQNGHSRSCTLYKRKKTLFNRGLRLHAMTKSEVLIIIDQPNDQRFVCGSNVILDSYKKGNLKHTKVAL